MTRPRGKGAPKSKAYNSTAEMLRALDVDGDAIDDIETALKKSNLARCLSALRSSRDIPQQRIADELGVTQSAVSKIEKGFDESLTVREIQAYAKVLGFGVEIRFMRPMTLAERIRYHSARLSSLMHELIGKVKGDKEIARGVNEVVDNLLLRIGEAIGRLRRSARGDVAETPTHAELRVIENEDSDESRLMTVGQ